MKPFNSVGTLVVLSLLEGFSFFGRTSALSPFLPSLCSDLSLSMTQLSGAYMLANLIAGLLLPFVGKYYDRTGLATFVKTFVSFFAFSFCFIGFLGPLTSRDDTSWEIEFIVFGSILLVTGFPPVVTVFFKERRSQFLALLVGTCIVFASGFMYVVAMNLDGSIMMLCVFSCLVQLQLIACDYREKKCFSLFFDLSKAFVITCIIGIFSGQLSAVVMCLFLIFLAAIIGCSRGKRKQVFDILSIILCFRAIKLFLDWFWAAVCCLCLVFLFGYIHLNAEDVLFDAIVNNSRRFRTEVMELIVILFPAFFFLSCGNTFPTWIIFLMLTFAFIGIRTAVQAYALAGRSWLATHFSKRRGFATGCVQLWVTTITASTPVICYQISQYCTCGMFFCALSAVWVMFRLVFCAFLPNKKLSKTPKTATMQHAFGIDKVLFVFIWLTLFFRDAQNSGIAFHLVSMCRDFGVNAKTISAAFMPISLLAVGMTFLFGHYFKRLGSRMSLGLFLLSDVGMLYAVKHIDTDGMLWLFIACTGLYWGINNIIASMVIPVLFGVRRIGALNGFAFGALSLGSAVGPFFFSIMKDVTSYKSALALCIDGVFLLLCLFVLLQNRIKFAEAGA